MTKSPNLSQASPNEFLAYAFSEIYLALESAKHPFHNFWISSINENQTPEIRTVILRHFSADTRQFFFHSDVRSKKLIHFEKHPQAESLFYAKDLRLQLRFTCNITAHYQEDICKKQMESMSDNSKLCYLYDKGPGESLSVRTKEELKETQALNPEVMNEYVWQNMAVIECEFHQLDLLWLHHKGHVRIKYNWLDEQGLLKAEPSHQFIVA